MVNMAPTWRPKSSQKRPKTVPTLSQMEPKMLPNQFFKAILDVFLLCRNLHRLFMDCLMIFCYLSRAQHIKNHGFSQVKCYILQNQLFRRKCQKILKNLPKPFKNQAKMHAKSTKMHPKSTKNRNKIEKDRPKNAKWFKMPKSSPKKCPSTAPCRREAQAPGSQEADPLRYEPVHPCGLEAFY